MFFTNSILSHLQTLGSEASHLPYSHAIRFRLQIIKSRGSLSISPLIFFPTIPPHMCGDRDRLLPLYTAYCVYAKPFPTKWLEDADEGETERKKRKRILSDSMPHEVCVCDFRVTEALHFTMSIIVYEVGKK